MLACIAGPITAVSFNSWGTGQLPGSDVFVIIACKSEQASHLDLLCLWLVKLPAETEPSEISRCEARASRNGANKGWAPTHAEPTD